MDARWWDERDRWGDRRGSNPRCRVHIPVSCRWTTTTTKTEDRPKAKSLDITRSDVTPNEGVSWTFHEWIDQSQCCTRNMVWGDGTAYVRQNSWKNRTDNVVHKYFHTFGLSGSFSLSFYNATATISPSSDQWSASAFASFSH